MMTVLRKIALRIVIVLRFIETLFWCIVNRLPFHPTWRIEGHLHVVRPPFYHPAPTIKIGHHFTCISRFTSNSLGVIQPVLIRCAPGAVLIIGEHVGISGCSIFSSSEVTIGNRVLIGSGTIITDSDAHPILPEERSDSTKTKRLPVHIGNDVFIGARCIILKGVTIGDGAVVGAGSVVSRDIPPRTIYAGNPAVFIRKI